MLKYLKDELNIAFTENGALTYKTSCSDVLDLFATIGALRNASEQEITARFSRAFRENPDLAVKTLFYARDVRGGLGERRVFRVIIRWLCENSWRTVVKNIELIPHFGRYDDLLVLIGTPCEIAAFDLIARQLKEDTAAMAESKPVSLMAKWLPSVNASDRNTVKLAKRIAYALNMTESKYRKTLSALRRHIRIIENNLRERDYTFEYEDQPSKAMFRYRAAFMRNDRERYGEYMNKVMDGRASLNTSTLYPYEIAEKALAGMDFGISDEEKLVLNATWQALPDYTKGENALAVVDTSGSMYGYGKPVPASVALSLGVYFAERNKGAFAGHFISFSENPQLIELKGESFVEKISYAASLSEIANTNLAAVFDLVLNTALRHNLPQSEMPSKLYVISDMEFDACVENGGVRNFERAKRRYRDAGYKLPQVVFWNVQSRNRQQPVRKNEQGAVLVSGCSPRIFDMVMEDSEITPEKYMMQVLMSNRYTAVAA
ncbi:MAG: DUF2828 family protein [Ruminococcaceae bacterium]|nr:DUF2828 family protein [Oscillospiraceae bacterium]